MESNLRTSPNDLLKERVKVIKHLLPRNIRQTVIASFPKYNTREGVRLMDNVLTFRSADPQLTEIMEAIAANQKAVVAASQQLAIK
jgi:hypothetical protein